MGTILTKHRPPGLAVVGDLPLTPRGSERAAKWAEEQGATALARAECDARLPDDLRTVVERWAQLRQPVRRGDGRAPAAGSERQRDAGGGGPVDARGDSADAVLGDHAPGRRQQGLAGWVRMCGGGGPGPGGSDARATAGPRAATRCGQESKNCGQASKNCGRRRRNRRTSSTPTRRRCGTWRSSTAGCSRLRRASGSSTDPA